MKKITLVVSLLFLCVAFAQDKYYTDAQKKLMSRRAAIMDGYRQLAEAVQGVKITSSSTVKDFVTEKDEIKADMEGFVLRGAQVTATRYAPDGTCEVDMELRLEDLVFFLNIAQNKYGVTHFKNVDFNQLYGNNPSRVLRATGSGASPGMMSEGEAQSLKGENEGLKAEIANLKRQLEQARSSQASIQALQQENVAYRQQLEGLKAEKEKLNQLLVQLQGEAGALRSYRQQYDSLLSQYRQLQGRIASLQDWEEKYKTLFAGYGDYKAKYEDASQKLASLQAQLTNSLEIQTRLGQLQAEIDRLAKEKEEMRARLEGNMGIHGKLSQVEKQNKHLQAENGRLLNQVEALEKEIVDLKGKIVDLTGEIETIKIQPQGKWVEISGTQKLAARRAAILDGYRQLLEALKGVRIDSKTTVKDFVTESDQISAATAGFVRGAQTGATRYLPDGTCEIEMSVDMDQFIRFLKQTARNYSSEKWTPDRFNTIYKHEQKNIIKVTGTGAFK